MKYNLIQLLAQCEYELASIGIITGAVKEIKINPRFTSTWGYCKKLPNGDFAIDLSKRLFEEGNEKGIKTTIIHELLHTCEGCFNHGAEWKAKAEKVNAAYGYNIKRCTSAKEKGIEETGRGTKIKYIVVCARCGYEFCRSKESNLIKYPSRYLCSCGGKLKRIL